jgi:hypothetical protein
LVPDGALPAAEAFDDGALDRRLPEGAQRTARFDGGIDDGGFGREWSCVDPRGSIAAGL